MVRLLLTLSTQADIVILAFRYNRTTQQFSDTMDPSFANALEFSLITSLEFAVQWKVVVSGQSTLRKVASFCSITLWNVN